MNIHKKNFSSKMDIDSNLDYSNAGVLGISINETSNIMDDLDFQMSRKLRQIFPNLADIPRYNYMHALRVNADDIFGSAGNCRVLIELNVQSLYDKANIHLGYREIQIPRDTRIKIGDETEISLFHPINIVLKNIDGSIVVSATYDTNVFCSISVIESPVIDIIRESNNVIYLSIPMGQFKRSITSLLVNKVDLGSTLKFEVAASDNICGFDCFIRKTNSLVTLKKFHSGDTPGKVEPSFILWDYDGSYINLSFSNKYYHYRPEVGDRLEVIVYKSDGTLGNMSYYGDDLTMIYDDAKEDTRILESIRMTPVLDDNIIGGGKSEITIDELKSYGNMMNTTKGTIHSSTELNDHFESLGITFDNIRQDTAMFLYRGNVISRDGNSITPTKTVDLIVDPEVDGNVGNGLLEIKQMSSYKVAIDNYNTQFEKTHKLDQETTDLVKDWRSNASAVYDIDNEGNLMMCPFSIKIMKTGPAVALSNTYINEVFSVKSTSLSTQSIHQSPVPYVTVKRNPLFDEAWNIDIPVQLAKPTLDLVLADPASVRFVIAMYGEDGLCKIVATTSTPTVDEEFPDVYHFTRSIKSSMYSDINGNVGILTESSIVYGDDGSMIQDEIFYIPPTVKMEVLMYVEGGIAPLSSERHVLEDIRVLGNIIPNGFEMVCAYELKNLVVLSEDYTDYFRPYIEPIISPREYNVYTKDMPKYYAHDIFDHEIIDGKTVSTIKHKGGSPVLDVDGNVTYKHRIGDINLDDPKPQRITYRIENIPLIKGSHAFSTTKVGSFFKYIKELKATIQSEKFILESNINIMFRFMNSFGGSNEYFAYKGTTAIPLDRSDIKLNFRVEFEKNIDAAQQSTIISSMELNAQESINEANTKGGFTISDILTELTQLYNDKTRKIEFVGINDLSSDFQSIGRVASTGESGSSDFISVREKLDRAEFLEGRLVYLPDISISAI